MEREKSESWSTFVLESFPLENKLWCNSTLSALIQPQSDILMGKYIGVHYGQPRKVKGAAQHDGYSPQVHSSYTSKQLTNPPGPAGGSPLLVSSVSSSDADSLVHTGDQTERQLFFWEIHYELLTLWVGVWILLPRKITKRWQPSEFPDGRSVV